MPRFTRDAWSAKNGTCFSGSEGSGTLISRMYSDARYTKSAATAAPVKNRHRPSSICRIRYSPSPSSAPPTAQNPSQSPTGGLCRMSAHVSLTASASGRAHGSANSRPDSTPAVSPTITPV